MLKAVILSGGFGKRLKPFTDTIPKPMIPIKNVPILEWQINWLKSHGFDEFILCTGYKSEAIVEYFGNGHKHDVTIHYSHEVEPLGTAGALKNAENFLLNDDKFLLMNGDIITNLDPTQIISLIDESNLVSISLVPLISQFGIAVFDDDKKLSSFEEKPIIKDNWINAGIYCFSNKIFSYLPNQGSLEREIFPTLALENKIIVKTYDDVKWRSIDSHKDIDEATQEF